MTICPGEWEATAHTRRALQGLLLCWAFCPVPLSGRASELKPVFLWGQVEC